MKKNLILIILAVVVIVAIISMVTRNTNKQDVMDPSMESEKVMTDDMKSDEMMKEETDLEEMKTNLTKEDMEEEMVKEVMIMNDGNMAPDFSLMTLDGENVTLADLKGEKVMIKFWASWCSICLSGLDEIDMLAGEMNEFKVLTIVSPDHNGEKSKEDFIEWFPSRETENLTVLLDDEGVITKQYGVRGYPTTAFIGTDGVLVKIIPGHIDNSSIISIFEDIK